MNVYGDVASTNIKSVASRIIKCWCNYSCTISVFNAILPNQNVSRTGYNEVDLQIIK
jgi:hypothetical protein